MATPIIGEILDVIRSVINWVIVVTPRWVKFLIFFSMLIVMGGVVMPLFYNGMGFFCVDDTLYKNPSGDVFTNFKLSNKFLEFDNVNNITIIEDKCLAYSTDTNTRYYQGGGCTNCTRLYTDNPDFSLWGTDTSYCSGDAHRYETVEGVIGFNWSISYNFYCEDKLDPSWYATRCMPPLGLYWEFNSSTYTFEVDNTIDYGNATNIFLNYLLKENIQPSPVVEDKLIGVSCFSSKPKLAIAGVDLFNYQLWLLFIFIGVLFWVYKNWA